MTLNHVGAFDDLYASKRDHFSSSEKEKTVTNFTELKPLVQSKTFWGAVVALVGSGISLGHYTLSPADAAQAVDLISGIVSAAGGLYAIYGRMMATKQVYVLPK